MNLGTILAATATSPWKGLLAGLLIASGLLLFAYRLYRLKQGGPAADAAGGAVLLVLLAGLALGLAADVLWLRWAAFVYALVFGLLVMPIWTLAVLIPLPPGAPDWAFTVLYWATLPAIAIAALLV